MTNEFEDSIYMNKVIAYLQRLRLRQFLMASLIGLTFLVSFAVGQFSDSLPAQAAPITSANQSKAQAEGTRASSGGLVESVKDTAETVKEKLNLDEPLPESTKLFFKQVQGEDVKVKEPGFSEDEETPKNE
ncbi:MAG: hypothetical protein KME43_19365 [Myxacorys chilensis ATA2-1-KO14]|nr:hypothetical protein [Myxacorys chilensis ATA2-1-KO14]